MSLITKDVCPVSNIKINSFPDFKSFVSPGGEVQVSLYEGTKISNKNKGKKLSESHKLKIGMGGNGKKRSIRRMMISLLPMPINLYDPSSLLPTGRLRPEKISTTGRVSGSQTFSLPARTAKATGTILFHWIREEQ